MSAQQMEQIYNMVWDASFAAFNKMYTTMCRFVGDCERENCTYAHTADELKPAICLYHFADGCSNSASQCKFSHKTVDAVKALKAFTALNAQETKNKDKEAEQLRKEEDAALQEDATVFFHKTVVAPLMDIENELMFQMEEEDILRDLEEQALADEVESMHDEEEAAKKAESFIVFEDDQTTLPDYQTLVSTVAQQQMLIQQMWMALTANQVQSDDDMNDIEDEEDKAEPEAVC